MCLRWPGPLLILALSLAVLLLAWVPAFLAFTDVMARAGLIGCLLIIILFHCKTFYEIYWEDREWQRRADETMALLKQRQEEARAGRLPPGPVRFTSEGGFYATDDGPDSHP